MSKRKELDADGKAIQQLEFAGELKKLNANNKATDTGNSDQYMFVLMILETIKETRLKFSQGSVTVL